MAGTGSGLALIWFIDRKNGLCGVGAILASLPFDAEQRQTFRRDIYRKYAAFKGQQVSFAILYA